MTPPLTLRRWLTDTAERSVASFLQALLVFLVTFPTAFELASWRAPIAAALQAAAAVLLSAIAVVFPPPRSWLVDTVIRTARTFAGTVLAAIAGGAFDLYHLDGWRTTIAAALVATLATFKAHVVRDSTAAGISPASWVSPKDPAR